jgi:hypothetical protein
MFAQSVKKPGIRASALILITIVTLAAISFLVSQNALSESTKEMSPFYVGVTFQGNTTAEAKLLIDKVKNYTNLFVLGSTPVSRDENSTSEVCDYAVAQGLNVIVNFGYYDKRASADESWRHWPWQLSWLDAAKQKYGAHFLGVHYDDEPSGMQVDYNWTSFFENYSSYFSLPLNYSTHGIYAKLAQAKATGKAPSDYDLEAYHHVNDIIMTNEGHNKLKAAGIRTFTSDYMLYWFDYLGGYDVVLAQLGWNHTYVQDIALAKGAARLQGKQWGVIVTWKYDEPPYLDSGKKVYEQMVAAYEAGAEYVMIFNYPKLEGNDYGVLQAEHFAALELFWKNVVTSGSRSVPDFRRADVALVLPRNYGWGMRTPDDKIWGMWGPDEKSPKIWEISRKLLSAYGLRLDIVYDDSAFPAAGKYNRIYYWNESI